MRLSRSDLVPVLAIIGSGAIGVLTSAVVLSSHSHYMPVAPPVVVSSATAESATRIVVVVSRPELLTRVDAIELVEDLQGQQREMIGEVRGLPTQPRARSREQIERLRERKRHMVEAVEDLRRELARSATSGQMDDPRAARAMAEVADAVWGSTLRGELRFSRGSISNWDLQPAVDLELSIQSELQSIRDQLELFFPPVESTVDPLIYIDGVRMPSEPTEASSTRRAGSASFLGSLDPDAIERIEVIKGPAATQLYGEEASGGVIQVFLKEPRQPAGN